MVEPRAAAHGRPPGVLTVAGAGVLVLAVLVAGWVAFEKTSRAHRHASEKLLAAVAELKVSELAIWREERLSDTNSLRENPLFVELAAHALADPPDPLAVQRLRTWLEAVRTNYGYRDALLVAPDGQVRLAVPEGTGKAPSHLPTDAPKLLQLARPAFLDFHLDHPGGQPVLASVAALRSPGLAATPFGLLVLRIDPSAHLYPLLARWPLPSRSAETLLVRRDGDQVVYLNPLRFAPDAALRLRLPASDPSLPAALAFSGSSATVLGRDYRGTPVLAALRQVPGSPWAVVARIDREEIDQPLCAQLRVLSVLVGALSALAAAVGTALWQWRQARVLGERYELERRFRTLFDTMAEGVATHEIVCADSGEAVDYRILDCNPAFTRQTGILAEQARGALASALYGATPPPYLETYSRVATTGGPEVFETYFPPLKRHFRVSVVSPQRGQFATVFEDISENRRREEELQRANEDLERFSYTISHSLKSPLVTVQTFLGFLQEDLKRQDAEKVAQDIDYIRNAAAQMSRLLEELLRLSRLGRVVNPPSVASFRELVQEALTAVAGQLVTRGVHVEVADTQCTLYGDRPRLIEIWQNLLDNAVKFMGDQRQPRIEVGCEVGPEDTVFFVRDNGQGIDPRHQHKVFGLFERLDTSAGGTGIGLAATKRIVELFGGRIWLESAGQGQGCTFRFTLPQALETAGRHT